MNILVNTFVSCYILDAEYAQKAQSLEVSLKLAKPGVFRFADVWLVIQ